MAEKEKIGLVAIIGIIAVLLFGAFILVLNFGYPEGGRVIVGYDCQDVSERVAIVNNSITFPVSGNCHFTLNDLNPAIYNRAGGLEKMDKELRLDYSCRSHVADFYPSTRQYANQLIPGSLAMYRDINGRIYACLGMGGT